MATVGGSRGFTRWRELRRLVEKVGASFHSMALAGGSIGGLDSGNFSPGLSWRLDRRLGLDGDSGPRALLDGVSWLNLWPGLDEKVGASLHSMA